MEVKEEKETIKSAAIEMISSPSPDGSPIRPIFCLKKTNMENIRKFDEIEDCFILDFDPSDIETSLHRISTLSVSSFTDDGGGGGGDLSVVAEKGQCYCYVCDCAAPCKDWRILNQLIATLQRKMVIGSKRSNFQSHRLSSFANGI